MTRRRTKVEVTLFPFLSVLCTVIGVLVLFIVLILSTRVVEQDELYRRTEEHRREVSVGSRDAVEQGIDAATYRELESELNRLKGVLAQRVEERDRLNRKLSGLEDLVEFKKTQQLLSTGAPRGRPFAEPEQVVVLAEEGAASGPSDGLSVGLKPVLIEVTSSGYTVHPERTSFPPIEKTSSDTGDQYLPADELKTFLRDLDKRKAKEYVVFLIHPNGVEAFANIRIYLLLNHEKLRLGWEPFSPEWIVANDRLAAERQDDE